MIVEPTAAVDLEYTKRYGALVAQYSIQDFYDLIVELITNPDDSYHGLFMDRKVPQDGGPVIVELEPHRSDRSSVVVVKDRAAGFSDLASKLKRVGERTSRAGDRGFMARGLKDCAVLGAVTVETIIDGRFDKAQITPAMQLIEWKSNRRHFEPATDEDRKRLGVRKGGNGTMVRVDLEPRVAVPRLETLKRELPWHYALRDIMAEGSPSTVRVGYGGTRLESVTWVAPEADLVHDREYSVPGYAGARYRFRLWKTRQPMEDPPDRRFRRTGVLVKGERGIHGVSFLASELEGDPAGEHYFGRIDCPTIDALAEDYSARLESGVTHPKENPMFLLDPNRRGGLEEKHPFTQALYQEAIEVLKSEFRKHRDAESNRKRQVEARETTDRLKRLAREASRFMREKLEEAGALGLGDSTGTRGFAESGVALYPAFTQLELGTSRAFTVRVAKKLGLPPGTAVKVTLSKCASRALELIGKPIDLEPDPLHDDLMRGSFTLAATAVSGTVQVACQVDSLDSVFSEVQVVAPGPREVEIPDGFAFHHRQYAVRPGTQKKLLVRARFDRPVAQAPSVAYSVSDPTVITLRKRGALELVDGTTYYEGSVVVEGKKLNGRATIAAEIDGRKAHCEVLVVSREEEGIELSFQLVDYPIGKNFRATWNREQPNTLLITTQHESVSRYLGDAGAGYPGQHSEPFRVLLAELISDNVCRRIVQEHARALPTGFDVEKVYALHNQLMREFTPIAHRIQLASPSR